MFNIELDTGGLKIKALLQQREDYWRLETSQITACHHAALMGVLCSWDNFDSIPSHQVAVRVSALRACLPSRSRVQLSRDASFGRRAAVCVGERGELALIPLF